MDTGYTDDYSFKVGQKSGTFTDDTMKIAIGKAKYGINEKDATNAQPKSGTTNYIANTGAVTITVLTQANL